MGRQIILVSGPPASGKGTQCAKLVERYGIFHLSTGDMLRAIAKSKSKLGLETKSVMESGGLVSDELVARIVEESIGKPKAAKGFILDGFPRTLKQAKLLEDILKKKKECVSKVVSIIVPDDQLQVRVTGRRIHKSSGRSYHITFNPPKVENKDDITGEDLICRRDDTLEALKVRLENYHKLTTPLLEFYENHAKTRVYTIDGTVEMNQVTTSIFSAIDSTIKNKIPNTLFSATAPNPRRVLIFAAELGIDETAFIVKKINLRKNEHKTKEFRSMNPVGQIPVLKIADNNSEVYISESIAICRYLDGEYASKSEKHVHSLFGNDPVECAMVEMWNRRIEFQLFINGIGKVWMNNPMLSVLAKKMGFKQSDSDRELGQRASKKMFMMLEKELSRTRYPFIAGYFFSVADITLLCSIDFGIGLAGVEPYTDEDQPFLSAWHQRVTSRVSVMKYPNPHNAKRKRNAKL